jgi:hypothetical protein
MRTNPITLVGIVLIVLGIVAFAYQGITYTSREKIIDIGPIHATADTQKTIPLSPLLGGLALVGGGRLGGRRSEEGVVRINVSRLCRQSVLDESALRCTRDGGKTMDLLWILAIAIVAIWLAVEFMRGHI